MTHATDPTASDEARYAEMADWVERLEDLPESVTVVRGSGEAPGRDLLSTALGGTDRLDRAIGRPNLQGKQGSGRSPVRQVRLPRDLDDALLVRAAGERSTPSEVLRRALRAYLDHAS